MNRRAFLAASAAALLTGTRIAHAQTPVSTDPYLGSLTQAQRSFRLTLPLPLGPFDIMDTDPETEYYPTFIASVATFVDAEAARQAAGIYLSRMWGIETPTEQIDPDWRAEIDVDEIAVYRQRREDWEHDATLLIILDGDTVHFWAMGVGYEDAQGPTEEPIRQIARSHFTDPAPEGPYDRAATFALLPDEETIERAVNGILRASEIDDAYGETT